MKYEENGEEIFFTTKTERIGKHAIIHAIEQVLEFWKGVPRWATFDRKDFDRIIIEIERVGVFHESLDETKKRIS